MEILDLGLEVGLRLLDLSPEPLDLAQLLLALPQGLPENLDLALVPVGRGAGERGKGPLVDREGASPGRGEGAAPSGGGGLKPA